MRNRRRPWARRVALVVASVAAGSALLAVSPATGALTFTVTSADDVNDGQCDATGHCSLREAILAANAAAGADTITFEIPGAGVHTIAPGSALPTIAESATIDGTTEDDYVAGGPPRIEIRGDSAGPSIGLRIEGASSANSVVRGLTINRFASFGIYIAANAANTRVEGNWVGLDATGTADAGNGGGIQVLSTGNTIGGTTPAARNVIAGNDGSAIGNLGGNTTVQGNYIGTSADGLSRIGNLDGITVTTDGNTIGGSDPGEGNVLSGSLSTSSAGAGVSFSSNAGGNTVEGNLIGTDKNGTAAVPNQRRGIYVGTDADLNNVIRGNVVSGNSGDGIDLFGPAVTVVGNLIGTTSAGTAALANTSFGIQTSGPGGGNLIGGTASGAGNVISGNSVGVALGNSGNVLQGNSIGTTAAGAALPNDFDGIQVVGGTANVIGGAGSGEANRIRSNGRDGVRAYGGTGARISANAISGNTARGIDLNGDGVTSNDSGDGDTGPNNLQNFPVLTSATGGASTSVSGSLDSASGSYRIEFFANAACDGTNGEGERYLGSTVTSPGPFTASGLGAASTSEVVTATATDAAGNTSEFSACRTVTGGTSPTGTIVVVKDAQPDDAQDFSFTAGGGLSPASFTLDDDSDGTLSSQQSFTVAPGSGYSVQEQSASGWTLSSSTCSDGSPVSNIDVAANETVTCTFINTRTAGTPTFTVNTAADTDDGACTTANCSLREAINRANSVAGANTISFDIPGTPPYVVHLATALPRITETATLDATTQPGFSGTPVVEIDGSTIRCGPGNSRTRCSASGFVVDQPNAISNTTIRGFAIGGFATGEVKVCVGSCNDVPFPGGHGIVLQAGHGDVVEGNYLGTDASGTQARPNQGTGVLVLTSSNRIGGTSPGQGNVISANGTAPYLQGGVLLASGSDNVVEGNRIGTGPAGTEALGNAGAGVVVSSAVDAFRNRIGGTAEGAANTIAHNTVGVVVVGAGARRSSIASNAIFDNGGLGIDLGADGVTANDSGDADTGANELQNFPVLSSVVSGGGETVVTGSLDGVSGNHRIEFFSNPACDTAGGYGEGRTYLGFENVVVSGVTPFTATLPVEVMVGHDVTATATGPDGSTSEFSACADTAAAAPPADLSITKADDADPVFAGTRLTYTLSVDNLGTGDADDVEVTDTLPAGVSFVSASDGGSETSGVVSWDLGTLSPPDPVKQLTLVVDVDAEQTAELSNTASVSTSSDDANGANDSDVETTAVTPAGGTVYPPVDPLLPPRAGIWSWGNGWPGKLGSGSFASRHVPGAVQTLAAADQMSAGWNHGLALAPDGTVRSWGYNFTGELGVDPSTTSCRPYGSSSPYNYVIPCREVTGAVPGLANVESVSAGASHSLALRADGAVFAWGSNAYAQLGVEPADTNCTGSTTSGTSTSSYENRCRSAPEQVAGLSGIVAIAAGAYHNLALDSSGHVYSWGSNFSGELGVDPATSSCTVPWTYGTTTYTSTYPCRVEPELVPGLSGIVAISAGQLFSLALAADGRVYAWGDNYNGQLGVEPNTTSCTREYTYSGSTWTYTLPCRPQPTAVPGLAGVARISAGASHALAATAAGSVYAWGGNSSGALGVEPSATLCTVTYGYEYSGGTGFSSTYSYTNICRGAPAQVSGLSGIAEIAAGASHSLARDAAGDVYAWGSNWSGELGERAWDTSCEVTWVYGTYSYTYTQGGCRAAPERVEGLTDAGTIAAGYNTSFAAGMASPNLGVRSHTATVPGGTTVSSDTDRDGATAADPVEVSVKSPNAGEVSISKSSSQDWLGDFSVWGKTIEIEAPNASSADDPIVLTFVVDESLIPDWYELAWVGVYRNGAWLQDCTGTGASPDPCVASRTRLADGDVELVVRTTAASAWTVGVSGPTADAGGPYVVDEGSTVELDATDSTGAQTPLSYLWSATDGLDDIGSATPSLEAVDDGVRTVELTVFDAIGLSDTDVAEVVVENVAPTASFGHDGAVEAGQSFQLRLTNPQDASPVDRAAGFVFAFDCGDGAGYGAWGAATTRTCPTSAAGSRTVRGRIRDKDGGVSQYSGTQSVVPSTNPCAGSPPPGAIVRGPGNDKITGTPGNDVIFDSGGTNTINAAGGNDLICTGPGADTITAGDGDDVVVDSGGKSDVKGGNGNDRITTGAADDAVDGGAGSDTLSSGGGNDTVVGGDGNDSIAAGAGSDKITGGEGNDVIDAGDGNNEVAGGGGNDDITAGPGNDKIDGGAGFDTCRPGGGTNTVRNCEA